MQIENSNDQITSESMPVGNMVLSDAVFRPMLFSTLMVQALLNGTKTQTRRGIKDAIRVEKVPQYLEYKDDWGKYMVQNSNNQYKLIKPTANIGDIIWVRETFVNDPTRHFLEHDYFQYKADIYGIKSIFDGKWKPSIFMPKKACRIWLKVTNVRVEKLQDITEDDAKNEGLLLVNKERFLGTSTGYKNYLGSGVCEEARVSYFSLWALINGELSYHTNPFVWVYDFEVIREAPYGFR
jgi:hypothetical protein